ncbi:MAG: hypothetical protein ACFFDR_14370, partial [Candidatus Thorarchaeota archaeon]
RNSPNDRCSFSVVLRDWDGRVYMLFQFADSVVWVAEKSGQESVFSCWQMERVDDIDGKVKFKNAESGKYVALDRGGDAYLSDQQECEKLAVQMKHQDIQLILLAPRFEYDVQAADKLAKLNHGVVLDIASIEELPEKLLRLTNY